MTSQRIMHNSGLDIDRIAFFGRTYTEYLSMFDLDGSVLKRGRILDCPAGASSFAAEAHQLGLDVTACDIMYNHSVNELIEKSKKDIQHVFEKFDEAEHLYVWDYYRNKEDVIALRKKALKLFSEDFPAGFKEKRYIHGELPHLPFPDKSFSLVLSGNFLFLYGDRLDLDFHKACMKELVRVCSGEVRIFPLVGLDAKPYPYLDEILSFLDFAGVKSEIVKAPFEFQKGANQMLKISL
ncbi:MAG: class I SAM-dependent methyltransferase [Nitrospirae bacterium]|nr:class I SAM-dependent methyltransferase [Nitrospirota bacterium]